MKKFLSIFIAVAMVMSFASVFASAPTAMAAEQNGITITAPAPGATIYTVNFNLSGTYDFTVSDSYDLYLTVTANGFTKHYTVQGDNDTTWTTEIKAGDFFLVTDGAHSYPVTVEGILVDHDTTDQVGTFDTGEVTYTWIPNGSAYAAFIDDNGNGVYDVGENCYTTIQAVIDVATTGDTVIVMPGTYTEDLTINVAGLELKSSAGAGQTKITGQITVSANNVTVDGFTVTNTSGNAIILGSDVTGVTVSNNHIEDSAGSIFLKNGANNCQISDNTIESASGTGVLLKNNSNITLSGNNISGGTNGIYFYSGTYTYDTINIQKNTIHECTYGIKFGDGADITNLTITGNDITNNTVGILINSGVTWGNSNHINYNNIFGNTNGIENSTTTTVDATNNWWGDISGPTHYTNPSGTGDEVSDYVAFYPWAKTRQSVVAPTPTPTTNAALDRAASGYKYIDPYPGPTTGSPSLQQGDTNGGSGFTTPAGDDIPTYTMGEYIDGTADTETGTVQLRTISTYDGHSAPYVVQTSNIAAHTFRLPTDNVKYDGVYQVWDATAHKAIGYVFIKYNMTVDQTSLDYCAANYISGYVKHGDGTGASGAAVVVLYPDGDYLVYATVDAHGQFGMTIADANGKYERGVYSIAVIDDYPSVAHHATQVSTADANNDVDAYIYEQLSTATFGWKLDTFVDPTILYENAAGEQTFVLRLLDETGAPVESEATNFTFTGWTETKDVKEISPGFYRFVGTVDSGVNYVKVKVSDTIGGVDVSASKTLAVTPLGVFNPQVVVDAHYSNDSYPHIGREVFDKLPCTVGNSLEIYPILYKPFENGSVATHYTVHSWDAAVDDDSPVTMVDNANYLMDYSIDNPNVLDPASNDEDNVNGIYLVNASGKISVHFDAEIWEMADYSCGTFDEGRNACCHTFDKDFNICETSTCTVDSISQTENDDGTYDIKIAISGDPNNAVDCELCDQIVAHIYTIDDVTDCEPNGDLDLWYNPISTDENPYDTGIDELPIVFGSTNVDFVRDGNTLIIKDVDLTDLCDDTFVVQVFGTETLSKCADEVITHPLIYENTEDITSPEVVTDISATADVDELVAGVCQTVTVTAPDFSGTPDWTLYFPDEDTKLEGYTVVDMGDGTYALSLNPALDDEGTLTIVGKYKDGCDVEKAVVDIPVVLPEFTVQIGLKDGSTIENDNIITEGLAEKIYVTATNPLTGEELTLEDLSVSAVECDCGIPSSVVYGWHPEGCEGISPLTVLGLDNPNVECDPQFKLYAKLCGADVLVDTFTLVRPTISADPTEDIPFYGCATCGNGTIVTFSVTDAHGHGAPNESIEVTDANSIHFDSASTGPDGTVKFNFTPTYQGNFYVKLGAAGGYAVGDIKDDGSNLNWTLTDTNRCVFDNWTEPLESDTTQILTTTYVEPPKDTEAPVIEVTAPEDGATVGEDTVTVEGTVTDNVGVTELYIGSQKIDFAPDGSFSATVELAEGENTIKVFAFDAAGNKAEKDLTVTYEKPAPVKETVVTVQIGSDVMTVNGQVEQLDVPPVIHEGHTYLPLRAIAEALGAKVDWIKETKGITLTLGDSTVGLQIGNVSAVVNGNVVAIFPPYLQPYGDGTYAATMVPLRVIAEGLGAEVNWDPTTRVVTITLVQQP